MITNLIIANIISNTFISFKTSQREIRSRARVVTKFHRYRDSANSTRLKLTSSREPYSQGYNGQVCQRCILFNLSKTKLVWRRAIPSDVSDCLVQFVIGDLTRLIGPIPRRNGKHHNNLPTRIVRNLFARAFRSGIEFQVT